MTVPVTLIDTDSVHGFIDFEHAPAIAPRKRDRQERKRAAALALQDRIGESFRALVTGVSSKATWVRVAEGEIEGRLVRGRDGAALGDEIDVVLLTADPKRGFIDFARVDAPGAVVELDGA